MVIENSQNKMQLIAEMHCSKPTPKVFDHVVSDLTIVVQPDFHGQGLGKLLFTTLLKYIEESRPDILRVELIARESNAKAIGFYEKIGLLLKDDLKNV